MKKVLVILPYGNIHLERFLQYVERTYAVDYFIHKNAGAYRNHISDNEILRKSISSFKLYSNVIRRKYDIIFTHGIFYPYLIFLHLAHHNNIIILSEMFRKNFNSGLKGLLKRIHFNRIAKNNSVSIFMFGDSIIKQQYQQLTKRSLQFYTYGMYPDLQAIKNIKSTKDKPIRFIFAGQFIIRKNITLILRSISITEQFKKNEATFTFIGEGPEENRIRSEPKANLLKTLPKKELFKVLAQSDVLVLVSEFEGWGAIVNEACACGCALILSRNVGAGKLFMEETRNGYYCDTNPESLSACFNLITENVEKLSSMKNNSQIIFRQIYSDHDVNLSRNISKALNSINISSI